MARSGLNLRAGRASSWCRRVSEETLAIHANMRGGVHAAIRGFDLASDRMRITGFRGM